MVVLSKIVLVFCSTYSQPYFSQRHRAHQRQVILRSAVAAGADEQRNKEGQRNGRLQGFFEMLQHAAGEALRPRTAAAATPSVSSTASGG